MDKTKLLAAFTTLHERALDYPEWGLSGVLLREFTARERQYAQEAVQEDGADPDQVLFRAMLIQRCVTDPDTGRPYADGRTNPTTGQPATDPRTRTPVFSVEDIADIADSRAILFNRLWDDLLALAAAAPADLFRGNHADERAERDAGASAAGGEETPGADASERPGDDDGGSEVPGGSE